MLFFNKMSQTNFIEYLYLVKAEDLNYTNYTTYEKLDELYPSKKKLFKKVA